MKADEATKKAAAAADASKPVEKSPHAKEVSHALHYYRKIIYSSLDQYTFLTDNPTFLTFLAVL